MPSEDPAGVEWAKHLGRKVSMRYRLHEDAEHPFSEAIGVVASVRDGDSGDVVTVVNRKGKVTAVPVADLLAVKVFPT